MVPDQTRRNRDCPEHMTSDRQRIDVVRTRYLIGLVTAAGSLVGIFVYASNLAVSGWNPFEAAAMPLFAILFSWIVFSFAVATAGFWRSLREDTHERDCVESISTTNGPTAVLVPVYNEQPDDVFARVAAMVRSLREQDSQREWQRASEFHFYILSDTTDPELWLEEELAWSRLNQQLTSEAPTTSPHVYYRHRSENVARKAGNIADFCEHWSAPYEFMIVLDADSLLEPSTMVAMVDAMSADDELGILQVPPTPIGRSSFFARLQQFSAAAYGPICCRGFDAWAGDEGNYWGHNAILRVRAFCDSCDLPHLPGEAPLGGEILSHDFVEAAYMVRNGWKVRLANEVGGSYEECPTTLTDYAMRDQRWCQGNLQHGRLFLSEGFHPASRLHFFSGVLSYVASPLWLIWTGLGIAGWKFEQSVTPTPRPDWLPSQLTLFAIAMALLLIPKLYGVIAIVMQRRSQLFGGPVRLLVSAALETGMSILLAPLFAVLHSRFVWNTLRGRKVRWNAQNRSERGVSLAVALQDYGLLTLVGVGVALGVMVWATPLAFWFTPMVLGLILAVPLAMLLGSQVVGQKLHQWKLLNIPQEQQRPRVSELHARTLAQYQAEPQTAESSLTAELNRDTPVQSPSRFENLLRVPSVFSLHDRVLQASESDIAISPDDREKILAVGRRSVSEIPFESRRAILSDRQLLQDLHAITQATTLSIQVD